MATVYSLACFGGRSGKTVTFTESGGLVNLYNHGLRQGVTGIVFSTDGILPTGISAGATYYPRDGSDGSTFTIYPTKADALAGTNQITFTGEGSGTHTVKSAYMLGLTAEQLSRYGSSGSERIYNGISEWKTTRSLYTSLFNSEVCEIGDSYDEISYSSMKFDIQCSNQKITTKVNGSWSYGFHGGVVGAGYRYISYTSLVIIELSFPGSVVEGIEILCRSTNTNGVAIVGGLTSTSFCGVTNCIVNGNNSGQRVGIFSMTATLIANNIILNCAGNYGGIFVSSYGGSRIINNIVTKCSIGIGGTSQPSSTIINNISVGNAKNFQSHIYNAASIALRNMGEQKDRAEFTVTVGSPSLTFSVPHERGSATTVPIVFHTTGTLPTVNGTPLSTEVVYWVKRRTSTTVITISTTQGGETLTFDGVGTGVHSAWLIWSHEAPPPLAIDFASPGNLFIDWEHNDFRPATSTSPQVDTGIDASYFLAGDMTGATRPNYDAATYPDNLWDVGPFEYDHGYGLAPATVAIDITGMIEGSVLAIYRTSDHAEIVAPTTIGASGAFSTTYSWTGNVAITVVVRKSTGGTKYLPYSAPGLITSGGFGLVVSQVEDGVLNG